MCASSSEICRRSAAGAQSPARSGERAGRNRQLARGLFLFRSVDGPHRTAPRTRRRAIPSTVGASNGSPLKSQTRQIASGDSGRSYGSCQQRNPGSGRRRVLHSRSRQRGRQAYRAHASRHDARIADFSPARGRLKRRFRISSSDDSRPAALSLARLDDRLFAPLHAPGSDSPEPRWHGSREDERLSLAPHGQPGIPRGKQEISQTPRNGLRRLLLHPGRSPRPDRLCARPRDSRGSGI